MSHYISYLSLMMTFELNDFLFCIRSLKNLTANFNVLDYNSLYLSSSRSAYKLVQQHARSSTQAPLLQQVFITQECPPSFDQLNCHFLLLQFHPNSKVSFGLLFLTTLYCVHAILFVHDLNVLQFLLAPVLCMKGWVRF